MEITEGKAASAGKSHQFISWSLIGILLFLRIIILGVVGIITNADWLITFYEVATYLFTAIFLWWEIKNLEEFHVDTLALLIIIVFKPIQTLVLWYWKFNTSLAFPNTPSLLLWAIAVGLGIACWTRRKDMPGFQWKSLGWFGLGTLGGIFIAALLAFPMSFQAEYILPPSEFWDLLKHQSLSSFIYQIGYAGVAEEPLFRGILWGALRKAGWREVWIWLFQAGLFVLAHIYYAGRLPISFFVLVPIGALFLGLLAWKTRSLSASLAAHGAMNTLGLMFGELVRYFIR